MTQTGWIDQPGTLADESVLPMLAELIGVRQVDHWFRAKTSFALVANELTVTVSNPFMQNWLALEFRSALQQVAQALTGNANTAVTFAVAAQRSSSVAMTPTYSAATEQSAAAPAESLQIADTAETTRASTPPRSLPRVPESIKPIPPIATTLPMVGVATPLVYGLAANVAKQPVEFNNKSSTTTSLSSGVSTASPARPIAVRESNSRQLSQFSNPAGAMLSGKAISTSTTERTPATAAVSAAPAVAETPRHRVGRRFLELREFVVGPCNQLAFAMAQHVGNSPGEPSNPLFIYGTCGNGKTHLAEGIYRQIKRQHPQLNVQFLTAAAFTNSFTQGIRERSMPTFRQRFRSIDVLIVDDVEFFDGKPGVQEEFLAQVKQLLAGGKQVVVTADRHPRLLSRFSDVLQSLFLSGAIVRIENPDLETRRQIVAQKSSRMELRLTAEALDLVAQRFSRNVRELEGALNCLQAHYLAHKQSSGSTHGFGTQNGTTQTGGWAIGVTLARQILGELERDCVRVVTVADIEHVVCQVFGITLEDLRSGSRTRTLSEPRALAMFLARSLTRCTYSAIGAHFGKRNHSTVVAAERRIAAAISERTTIRIAARNWTMDSLVDSLRQQLLAG